jgi:hypothetical protein
MIARFMSYDANDHNASVCWLLILANRTRCVDNQIVKNLLTLLRTFTTPTFCGTNCADTQFGQCTDLFE